MIASKGPQDPYYHCYTCGQSWKKRVWLRWPIRIFWKWPWPYGGPWLNSWGIEETGRSKIRGQQTFSRVYKIGPIGVHVGYGSRRG